MCVRYSHELTNLALWASKYKFKELQTTSTGSESFPGSRSGLIALSTQDGERSISQAQWGLIPVWAKNPNYGKKSAYNARCETVAQLPTFRTPFQKRRCLIPATAFYERGEGRWLRFSTSSSAAFAIAGLYELPNAHCDLCSYTMVTTIPNEKIAAIHDRMPVILDARDYETWLDPSSSAKQLLELLRPCPPSFLDHEDAGPIVTRKKLNNGDSKLNRQ